eukprot:m.696749 g.696749  ORF g.696749 m.696749 type:complete len:299 (-) comp58673_c0_seq75:116-1012(-)
MNEEVGRNLDGLSCAILQQNLMKARETEPFIRSACGVAAMPRRPGLEGNLDTYSIFASYDKETGDVKLLCRYTDGNKLEKCQELVLKCEPAIITAECDAWDGNTAFHMAAMLDHLPLLLWFMQQGVDVNTFNRWGRTALMMAAFWDDLASVEALLVAGADTSLKSKEGKTALQIAQDMKRSAIVTLLEDHERLLAQRNIKPAVRYDAPLQRRSSAPGFIVISLVLSEHHGTAASGRTGTGEESELAPNVEIAGPNPEQSPIQSAQSAADGQKLLEQEAPVPTAVMNLALTDLDLNLHE